MLGLVALHNNTDRAFLTSDNPACWFDPSVSFSKQRPYNINPVAGPAFLIFPVSPRLILAGSTDSQESFRMNGLMHGEVPSEQWVESANAQISRFAYEAVIAQSRGQEDVTKTFADVSPVHEAISLKTETAVTAIHRYAFGPRAAKPKWRDT